MFVLHTAREVVAETIGRGVAEVLPTTALESATAAEALATLFARVAEAFADDQVIDSIDDAGAVAPSIEGLEGLAVADLAAAVTCAAVRLIISTRLDVVPEELQGELNFALDLGADSLTRVDLVLLLEEALEVSVPDDSMFLVQTVGDAELFAVLFDRTREELVIALGEGAQDLAFDTPLSHHGDGTLALARAAAADAVGGALTLPECDCSTLKEAVRLAFLAAKLRRILALAAEVELDRVTDQTIPVRDLGLDASRTRQLLDQLTRSMELGPAPTVAWHDQPFIETVRALAEIPVDGAPR